jgi:bifunctional UDP-N-acetylglucosamine pyrophosphorylase/glucosamine-1-phosphate N-acetyltransferase
MLNKAKIVILAAGQGTRMKSELPKVLVPFMGKPMIKHLLDSVHKSGLDKKPVVVVGYEKEKIMKELGSGYNYVVQKEQLGTGHAVMSAEKILKNKTDNIIVFYGDHPFISPKTIKKLFKKHLESKAKITLATTTLPDFKDWRSFFYKNFGRIVRNKKGEIIKIAESKDANEEEIKIKEVNPAYYCFNAVWLWKKLKMLKTNNVLGQYYLTDLVQIAMQEKTKIESINIDPKEALGINSKEDLEMLEKLAK